MIKTLEEFLENLKEVSGDDYSNFDFSNSKFDGLTKNIQYVCNIHHIHVPTLITTVSVSSWLRLTTRNQILI